MFVARLLSVDYLLRRYAHPSHAAARHAAHARQRPTALLLRILHLRHRRRAALGRYSAPAVLPRPTGQHHTPALLVSIPPFLLLAFFLPFFYVIFLFPIL